MSTMTLIYCNESIELVNRQKTPRTYIYVTVEEIKKNEMSDEDARLSEIFFDCFKDAIFRECSAFEVYNILPYLKNRKSIQLQVAEDDTIYILVDNRRVFKLRYKFKEWINKSRPDPSSLHSYFNALSSVLTNRIIDVLRYSHSSHSSDTP